MYKRQDILPLIMGFLDRFNTRYRKNLEISSEALHLMELYDWPGNIRQVENFIERLVVITRNQEVLACDLPEEFRMLRKSPDKYEGSSLPDMLEDFEREIFASAFRKYRTSIAVGKALGIGQTTAARKLRKYIPEYTKNRMDHD